MKAKYRPLRYRPLLMITMAMMGVVPMALPGAELGRLFTTPQERATLDKLRREGAEPVAASEEVAPLVTSEPTPEAQPPSRSP